MSLVVKFIKQNKATVQAITSMVAGEYPEGSQLWWDARVQVVQDFFRNNPLNLGVPNDGASDFIKAQLERGNKYEKSRIKIWNQIALELHEIPDFQKHVADEVRASMLSEEELNMHIQRSIDQAEKTPHLPSTEKRTPSAHLPNNVLALIAEEERAARAALAANRKDLKDDDTRSYFSGTRALDEDATRGSDDDDEDLDDEDQDEEDEDDGLLVIANAATAGGVVGRQEQWLAQKRSRMHNKRREQEAALQSGLTFMPDTQDSRRTFKMKSTQPVSTARRSSLPSALAAAKDEATGGGSEVESRRRSYAGGDPDTARRMSDASSKAVGGVVRRTSIDSVGSRAGAAEAKRSDDSSQPPDRRRRLSANMRRLSKIKDDKGDKAVAAGGGSSSSNANNGSRKKKVGGKKEGGERRRSKTSLTGTVDGLEDDDDEDDEDDDDESAPRRRSFSPSTLRGAAPLLGDTPSELRRSRSLTDFEAAAAAAAAAQSQVLQAQQGQTMQLQGGEDEDEDEGAKDDGGAPPALSSETSSENRWRAEHPDSPYVFDVYSDTYVPGEFFHQIVNGRAHVKIRNGADFQMRSMYRKKDKFNRIPGVSLLVGRLERPPHDERIITIMFDEENFNEAQAWEWWQENKRRFLDDAYQRAVAAGRSSS